MGRADPSGDMASAYGTLQICRNRILCKTNRFRATAHKIESWAPTTSSIVTCFLFWALKQTKIRKSRHKLVSSAVFGARHLVRCVMYISKLKQTQFSASAVHGPCRRLAYPHSPSQLPTRMVLAVHIWRQICGSLSPNTESSDEIKGRMR